MDFSTLIPELIQGLANLTPGNLVMIAVAATLIALAVVKQYEPVLLLPIGFGCLVANIPLTGMTDGEGLFGILYRAGISTELFPLLIFIGVGAMIDFGPLLAMPRMALLGAAGQFGIFGTLILATLLGFPLNQAASIGVIGAIDGPTSIYVASQLAPELLAPIAVAAYSYMSLVPIIQPPLMRLLTSRRERRIRMAYAPRPVSRQALILFPLVVTLIIGLLVPAATPLISMLMLGNLLRESGVVERLSNAAQNEVINVATLFLGLTIGSTMGAESFLSLVTLQVLGLGLLAFVLDTVAGLLFGKVLALVSGGTVNPLIGAAGISAFPMAGRLAAKVALAEDPDNFILMHAMGANTAGQLGSVVAGGALLALVSGILG
ncbi:sodium ion-translocating decarboxylase subunit beta [Roseiflexus castenholzii]|jgi:oxaloacetate decarboxylase beta subunit|uniref:Sodium ion-translocating decarboxylase, beta subunit n=1 Tax=Roseiflexus castenholzii (strain DSM 13941 / HLO8) TaxID=383372 RepID=A7NHX0_ROSCS|nr:sodium ion-translocating decarboxylase subunit beta [Roseiflexus castenholzii]ABU57067.1 sodium ion-translocating decarboxylase, beta subunit [Roseiflexus castenholzii DSM 13941]